MSKFNFGSLPLFNRTPTRPVKPAPDKDERRAVLVAAKPGLTTRARKVKVTLAGKKS